MRDARLRRSLMLTPGHRQDRMRKALALDVDGTVFDLEDGVPPARKDEARAAVAAMLRGAAFGRRERLVRINAPGTPDCDADLAALPLAQLDALMVPKVERADTLAALDQRLRAAEAAAGVPAGQVRLVATLETPRGVLNALPIADATERCVALFFGPGDYTAQTGGGFSQAALLFPRSAIAAAAGAAGCQAIDAPFLGSLTDADATGADAAAARELGFSGKVVFHPAQVAAVNAAFTPTPAERARARKVVEAYRTAMARGEAVALVDGEFIAMDLVPRMERVLRIAAELGLP